MCSPNTDGANKGHPCMHRAYKLEFTGPLLSRPSEGSGSAARATCSQGKGTLQQSQCETPQTWHRTRRKKAHVSTGPLCCLQEGPMGLGRSYTEPFHKLQLHRVETLLVL